MQEDKELKNLLDSIAAEMDRRQDQTEDRELEALIRILSKEEADEQSDAIIRRLLETEPLTEKEADRSEKSAEKAGRPVMTAMLATFAVLLLAAVAVIFWEFPIGSKNEPVPSSPASLCQYEPETESSSPDTRGYMLGIEGDCLAVYYNGEVRESLSFPVAQLSEYDRKLLQNGIPLENETALRRAIEDYIS